MAEKKVIDWFTMNGKHIPIFDGESKGDAVNRSIAKDNEDIKQKQIAKHKEEVDKLSGKRLSGRDKKFESLGTDRDEVKKAIYNQTGMSPKALEQAVDDLDMEDIIDAVKQYRKSVSKNKTPLQTDKKKLMDALNGKNQAEALSQISEYLKNNVGKNIVMSSKDMDYYLGYWGNGKYKITSFPQGVVGVMSSPSYVSEKSLMEFLNDPKYKHKKFKYK